MKKPFTEGLCIGIDLDEYLLAHILNYHLHIHFDLAYKYSILQCGIALLEKNYQFLFPISKVISIILDARY